MTELCTTWIKLSDRQFLGEDLTQAELDFVTSHQAECPYCGREAALLCELRPAPLHAVPSDEEVERILLLADLSVSEPTQVPERSKPRHWRVTSRSLALCAGALALAASVLLVLWQRDRPVASNTRPTDTVPANAVPVKPKVLSSRATEDSCGPLVPGIVLCLTAGSEVGAVELEGPRRVVELKRGRAVASLEPQAKGTSFSISTRDGDVTAVGTIFSVELGRDGRAYARVARGKVVVRSQDAKEEQLLLAGQQLRLGDASAVALPLPEAERDLELVGLLAPREEFEAPRSEPVAAQGAEPAEASGVSSARQPALNDELGRARELRARGSFSQAAAIYRSIHARSPRSESGRAALMSLASLQLSSLGDPTGALASYQAYLAGGKGPLRQQAEYGKIRALRRLGRLQEELQASRAFIEHYPNAPEARLLRERLPGAEQP